MDNKIYLLIGLSTKAGRLTGGEDAVEKSIKSLKAQLVIVAEDASDNTRKKFMDICKYRNIEMRFFGSKELLGRYSGKELRAVLAITDKGLADRLKELIDGRDQEIGGGMIGKK